jgi:putative ABC transport system permease protein
MWLREFGGDVDVIGQTVLLEEDAGPKEHTIVGILSPSFQISGQDSDRNPVPDLWRSVTRDDLSTGDFEILGRLKRGIAPSVAEEETKRIFAGFGQTPPPGWPPELPFKLEFGARILHLQEQQTGATERPLYILFAASALLLIISCCNVANLLLGRAAGRQNEITMRAALGASRFRVIRQLITENLILSSMSAGVGALFAIWLIAAFIGLAPADLPRAGEIGLDFRVLAFMIIVSVLAGIVFGLAPSLSLLRTQWNDPLKQVRGSYRSRLQTAVIVAEIAICFVLLAGAALVTQSLFRLTSVDPGFRSDRLLTVQFNFHCLPRDILAATCACERFTMSCFAG